MNTPWGRSDNKTIIAKGITSYSTPSHGGLRVHESLNLQIPDYMRHESGWYEEDCDWSIVAINFPQHFIKEYKEALHTFRNWYPDAYERYFSVELKPGESHTRDSKLFKQQHAEDYIVEAAFGYSEGSNKVPKGFVGAFACRGGRLDNGRYSADQAYFLVPAEEYDGRGKFGFVVDEAKHQRIGKI